MSSDKYLPSFKELVQSSRLKRAEDGGRADVMVRTETPQQRRESVLDILTVFEKPT